MMGGGEEKLNGRESYEKGQMNKWIDYFDISSNCEVMAIKLIQTKEKIKKLSYYSSLFIKETQQKNNLSKVSRKHKLSLSDPE